MRNNQKKRTKKQRFRVWIEYRLRRQIRSLHKTVAAVRAAWERQFANTEKGVYLGGTLLTGVFSGFVFMETGRSKLLSFLVAAAAGSLLFIIIRLFTALILKLLLCMLCSAPAKEIVTVLNLAVGLIAIVMVSSGGYCRPFWFLFGCAAALTELFFFRSFWALFHHKRRTLPVILTLTVTAVTNLLFILSLIGEGFASSTITEYRALAGLAAENKTSETTELYSVGTFSYGLSGEEYESKAVGLEAYVKCSGFSKWIRELYWGFGMDAVPLAGQVWYPNAERSEDEKYPVLFIIHGNHIMTEESHLGYAYLGEYLATRGYVVISVDENCLNGYINFGLSNEDDARAVLLLENIKWMNDWCTTAESPLYGLAEFSDLTVAGHSRGGEAAAIAAVFNSLDCYPDNGMIEFDYGFDIESVIAIAPTWNQYLPAGQMLSLEDVNYLLVQGANDGDVSVFMGMDQYQNISFTGEKDCFKTYLYVAGANHGQFNSVWGRYDQIIPLRWFLNTKELMEEEKQQELLCICIERFLNATIEHDEESMNFFADSEQLWELLPETVYISGFQNSSFTAVADYEEDCDLVSQIDGTTVTGRLSAWKEIRLTDYSGIYSYSMQNHAVSLAWTGKGAYYGIRFEEAADCSEREYLQMDAMFTDTQASDVENFVLLDFTITLKDRTGASASVRAGDYALLFPPLNLRLNKGEYVVNSTNYRKQLQTLLIPLEDFTGLELGGITEIRLTFDQIKEGEAVFDNIGFSK